MIFVPCVKSTERWFSKCF